MAKQKRELKSVRIEEILALHERAGISLDQVQDLLIHIEAARRAELAATAKHRREEAKAAIAFWREHTRKES